MRGETVKTIAEIAKEIGVSKQAVYKRYKGKLYTVVYPYAHTETGTTYIDEQGENIIKSDFSNKIISNGAHTDRIQDTRVNVLLIEMLKKELEIKNKQIEELAVAVKNLSESINNANKNELAETIIDGNQKLIGENKIKNKIGIFKIFSRKK